MNAINDMDGYGDSTNRIDIFSKLNMMQGDEATEGEIQGHRRLAEMLVWMPSGVLREAPSESSSVQQQLPRLNVNYPVVANKMLKEMRNIIPVVVFLKPSGTFEKVSVFLFSGVSFEISPKPSYGQTRVILGYWIQL